MGKVFNEYVKSELLKAFFERIPMKDNLYTGSTNKIIISKADTKSAADSSDGRHYPTLYLN